MEYRLHGMRL